MLVAINEGVAVLVTMDTSISDGENQETVHIATDGRFFKKNGHFYLQFKEENQEMATVNQIVKIDASHEVTVIRQGAVSMKQPFQLARKTTGVYRSQYGTMLMETMTNRVDIQLDEQIAIGTIQLAYQLHMQHQFAGDYLVTIKFRRISK
jgi:uncharacterized beta-barrel protein YwiB (DUF1934 family)